MARKVGLLLVHGIGRQKPGELAETMKRELSAGSTSEHNVGDGSGDPTISSESDAITRRFSIEGTEVLLREANWSALSDPDNALEVRLVPYVVSAYISTLAAALRLPELKALLRELRIPGDKRRKLVKWGIAAIIIFTLSVIDFVWWVWIDTSEARPRPHFALALSEIIGLSIFAVFMFLYPVYCAIPSVNRRRHTLLGRSKLRRNTELGLWWLRGWAVGYMWAILIFVFAVYVSLFFIPVAVALVLNYAVRVLAHAVNAVARGAEAIGARWLRRWTIRTGWIVMVMPAYALLQIVKATGNLFSVGISDASPKTKAAAIASIPAVFLAFMVLVLFCEILIIFAVFPAAPFWIFHEDPRIGLKGKLFLSFVFLGFFIGMAKLLLPIVDLVLDAANYHLASRHARSTIQGVLEKGLSFLKDAGCEEIHILAHSLGTVIIVDLLQTGRMRQYPITVLNTIGSPLDKFWYLDRAHVRTEGDTEIVSQPNLSWTNYWASSDVVSGELDHFEQLGGATVTNVRLKSLGPLIVSHGAYWQNKQVLRELQTQITKSNSS